MAKRKTAAKGGANEYIVKPGVSAWGEAGENMVDEDDDDKWAEMTRKKIAGRGKDYSPPTREESLAKARERVKKRASSKKKKRTGNGKVGKGFTLYWPWPAPPGIDQ